MKIIEIPPNALVVPVGCSASGKSTFGRKHLGEGAVVSSDECRLLVSGSRERQDMNQQVFDLFHRIIDTRLEYGLLTYADATNLEPKARQKLYEIAVRHKTPVEVLIFDTTKDRLLINNLNRDRQVPEFVFDKHWARFHGDGGARAAMEEHPYHYLQWPYDATVLTVPRTNVHWVHEGQNWWIIGDVHGCYDELVELLAKIPLKDRLAFVGDFVDRGPKPKEVLNLVQELIESHRAVAVGGNHDRKAYRAGVLGNNVKLTHGLAETLVKVEALDLDFIGNLPHQVHLKSPGYEGTVTVVHGALRFMDRGLDNKAVNSMCLYGETDGTTNAEGFPTRTYEWVKTWEPHWMHHKCVFGHTPVKEVKYMGEFNNCVNIDTGCAFGGKLTAYNPFSCDILEVKARDNYAGRLLWEDSPHIRSS